jgi:hypothetical protein
MRLTRKFAALVLALGMLAVTAGVAYANVLGRVVIDWPNRAGDPSVNISVRCWNPPTSYDRCRGEFYVGNRGDIDHVYVIGHTMKIERLVSGNIVTVPSAWPLPHRVYPDNNGQLLNPTDYEGCRHPDKDPNGILHGDTVWSTVTYHVVFNNGDRTSQRTDSSIHIRVDTADECT